jgi:hypothetical protein
MLAPALQRCTFHQDRAAFARCMSCAKMLCQTCATQWDGIWHCAACLAQRRGARVERSPVGAWLGVVTLSLILLYVAARLTVWTAAVIAGLL